MKALKSSMLGGFRLLQKLTRPKRLRADRVTLIEPLESSKRLGLLVARVMGYQYIDLTVGVVQDRPRLSGRVVISRLPSYQPSRSYDGLTVRVEAVCDLENEKDILQNLRCVMLALSGGSLTERPIDVQSNSNPARRGSLGSVFRSRRPGQRDAL
jgi:hypothetical protein